MDDAIPDSCGLPYDEELHATGLNNHVNISPGIECIRSFAWFLAY